jgi:glycerophosphoryl diester phosphodiesterase
VTDGATDGVTDGVTDGALAIAHRAGNSLTRLRQAVQLRADVVEADVNAGPRGLEVHHLKTMGPLPWLWDRWELRPAKAPRLGLRTLLEAAAGGVTFMLDLKGHDAALGEAVARELHDVAPGREVLVCTRNWPALAPFEEIGWARAVRSARTAKELAALRHDLRSGTRAHGVSVHRSLLTPDVAAALHRHVSAVLTWPVNDDAALDRVLTLRGSGTIGVISDEASVLRRLLAER